MGVGTPKHQFACGAAALMNTRNPTTTQHTATCPQVAGETLLLSDTAVVAVQFSISTHDFTTKEVGCG
jgi:predicted double-glycine peptidase